MKTTTFRYTHRNGVRVLKTLTGHIAPESILRRNYIRQLNWLSHDVNGTSIAAFFVRDNKIIEYKGIEMRNWILIVFLVVILLINYVLTGTAL